MQIIHKVMGDGFRFTHREPCQWGEKEKLSFVHAALYEMAKDELSEHTEQVRQCIPETHEQIETESFKNEWNKSQISTIFTPRNVEIIKSYTYANDTFEESEKRADDYQTRFKESG